LKAITETAKEVIEQQQLKVNVKVK
jgi:hypothetical protein